MTGQPTALISGANRGIGAAVARRLAQDGWALSLGMRDPVLPDFADPDRTHLFAYDATAKSEAAWVAETMARFGRIDAIVANAGIMIPKSVIEAEDDELDTMLAVNVKAPRRLVKAAFEPLAESGRGRVIILASLSGKRVKSEKSGLYAMTKFAAVALAHGIRQAGYHRGIRATAVCPSFVATDMARALTDRDEASLTDPSELADVIAMLIGLSNTASVAEFAVNCQLEEQY
ncbi:SDR family NAD(P)-dependent oxidoreductase [Jiella sp. MQZ9-1]|uniref:SDR family NAD(P)-dependent oxidoreductase n=1 Tax=Jiella flava TaxID=2816857 RepID=A0A939JSE1_9HYPH|nr:SDR family NAD(P)-dependent oxidoreductase [Jiella flava]MBO0662868.1 SDR family NAD(P)-dependent oxidoreductase [Jiella flava]MCD2471372.1 SDR family NAD(P)-dependent oxidoreductase [Jiella flava]